MLIVIENGKLVQAQSPGYFSTLSLDWKDQVKLDLIVVPLEYDLKDVNGRILTRGDYRGTGNIVTRGDRKIVFFGDGRQAYLEEYEIGDVTKESDDFFTGVLWGVFNAFVSWRRKTSPYIAALVREPREPLPRSSTAARDGVKYGESEFKRLFGRGRKK